MRSHAGMAKQALCRLVPVWQARLSSSQNVSFLLVLLFEDCVVVLSATEEMFIRYGNEDHLIPYAGRK